MSAVTDYRTAAFIATALIPRLRLASSSLGASADGGSGRYVRYVLEDDPSHRVGESVESEYGPIRTDESRGITEAIVALEFIGWLSAGQRIGFFAQTAVLRELRDQHINPLLLRELADLQDVFATTVAMDESQIGPVDTFEFRESLVESSESLTLAHLEYLRLIHFAPAHEWTTRINRLWDLGEALHRRPQCTLSDASADDLSWGLTGAEPTGIARTPSQWRFDWVLQAQDRKPQLVMGPNWQERAAERLSNLAAARSSLESVALTLTDDEVVGSATQLSRKLDEVSRDAQGLVQWMRGPTAGDILQTDEQRSKRSRQHGESVREETKERYRQAGGRNEYEGEAPYGL